MASLQDQLLKAGVVDKKKAKKIAKEKRQQAKQTPKGHQQHNEAREQAIKARQEKADHDRELSKQQNEKAERKAIAAQIKQLIDVNRIDRRDSDIAYQFTDGKKIKKLYVTSLLQTQLINGQIAIVKFNDDYELVPKAIADKICERDGSHVLVLNDMNNDIPEEDDPYADYKIPDDLMW